MDQPKRTRPQRAAIHRRARLVREIPRESRRPPCGSHRAGARRHSERFAEYFAPLGPTCGPNSIARRSGPSAPPGLHIGSCALRIRFIVRFQRSEVNCPVRPQQSFARNFTRRERCRRIGWYWPGQSIEETSRHDRPERHGVRGFAPQESSHRTRLGFPGALQATCLRRPGRQAERRLGTLRANPLVLDGEFRQGPSGSPAA